MASVLPLGFGNRAGKLADETNDPRKGALRGPIVEIINPHVREAEGVELR